MKYVETRELIEKLKEDKKEIEDNLEGSKRNQQDYSKLKEELSQFDTLKKEKDINILFPFVFNILPHL